MVYIGLAFGVTALVALVVAVMLRRRVSLLESDLEMALSVISNMSAVLVKHTTKLEEADEAFEELRTQIGNTKTTFAEFKERFDDVMTEAEKQIEEEIKWNTGLNNILNFCLDDAFNAGGKKQ